MNIPRALITSLGADVMATFRKIDLLIDVYETQGRATREIDIYSADYDKVNRRLQPFFDLKIATYRGYKINRKIKPRRQSKRALESFEFTR